MAITRLQQARQMFRYGGDTMGGPNDRSSRGPSGPPGGGGRDFSKGPETTRHNPHTDTGTSKTSTVTGDKMRSSQRDFIQTLNTNNAIRAAQTGTKFSPYDGGSMFAPTNKPKFNLKSALFNAALYAINPALAAKYGKAKSVYNAAKFASGLAQDLGITDTNVAQDFISNLTNKGRTTSKKSNETITRDGGGDGIGSTPEMAALRDEYYLLLQKLQMGNILDSEKNRLTALKNLLGMA
tara:strand:- start:131 stop:844 length:714 start_codon:yes stop_codon:yes gene_type:complete